MLEQFTHSLGAWLALGVVATVVGLVALLKWKDRQLAQARVKLVEQRDDASNERLRALEKTQEIAIEDLDKKIQDDEFRLSRVTNGPPGKS